MRTGVILGFAILFAGGPLSLLGADGLIPTTHPSVSNERDQDRPGQTQVKQFRGELLRIEGKQWVIRDAGGQQIRVHVDENTQKSGSRPRIGDRIEVNVDPQGHARSIRRANAKE